MKLWMGGEEGAREQTRTELRCWGPPRKGSLLMQNRGGYKVRERGACWEVIEGSLTRSVEPRMGVPGRKRRNGMGTQRCAISLPAAGGMTVLGYPLPRVDVGEQPRVTHWVWDEPAHAKRQR